MYMHISLDAFWPTASNGKSVSKQKHVYNFIQFMCMYILCRYIRMLTVIILLLMSILFIIFDEFFLQRIFISSYRPSSNYWTLQDLIFISLNTMTQENKTIGNRNPVTHTRTYNLQIYYSTIRICIGHTWSPLSLSPQQCVRYSNTIITHPNIIEKLHKIADKLNKL